MNSILNEINTRIYKKCELRISNFRLELESKEYDASRFDLNGLKIVNRTAKVTPKKIGQFVTFWKRNENGITEPLNETDSIDFYVITVLVNERIGQFIFPKSILLTKGILSTEKKEGKRGFRIYPIWDEAKNKQALKTQEWQLNYFYEVGAIDELKKVKELFSNY